MATIYYKNNPKLDTINSIPASTEFTYPSTFEPSLIEMIPEVTTVKASNNKGKLPILQSAIIDTKKKMNRAIEAISTIFFAIFT